MVPCLCKSGDVPTLIRKSGPEFLRIAAFVGIVALHVNARGGFKGLDHAGFVVDELARFAVPAFFLLSGFFWKESDVRRPDVHLLKIVRRVLPAFLFWLIIYNILGALGYFGPAYQDRDLAWYPTILWSGGAGYHLWFLPALIVGAAILSMLYYRAGRLLWPVLVGLYLIGVVLGAYGPSLIGRSMPSVVFRNGIFFAPIFLGLGLWMRSHTHIIARVPTVWLVAGTVIFASIHMTEGYFISGRYPGGHDYSLATIGFAFCIFAMAIKIAEPNELASQLGVTTFGAFLVHAIILEGLLALGLAGKPIILTGLTVVLSLSAVIMLQRLFERSPALKFIS